MKYLPWLLLAAVLAYPLFAQTSSTQPRAVKVFGQPAASDWIDIESGTLGGQPTQYVVPAGQVLTLQYQHVPVTANGNVQGNVSVDGVTVAVFVQQPAELQLLHLGASDPWTQGETVREGQVVTLTRTGGNAGQSHTFVIRGWLEEIR